MSVPNPTNLLDSVAKSESHDLKGLKDKLVLQ